MEGQADNGIGFGTAQKTSDVIAYAILPYATSCDQYLKLKWRIIIPEGYKVNPCRQPRNKVSPGLNKVTRDPWHDQNQITAPRKLYVKSTLITDPHCWKQNIQWN